MCVVDPGCEEDLLLTVFTPALPLVEVFPLLEVFELSEELEKFERVAVRDELVECAVLELVAELVEVEVFEIEVISETPALHLLPLLGP